MIKQVFNCRSCNQDIFPLIRLPSIYPSLFSNSPLIPEGWERVPLYLFKCNSCGLVQLGHSFSPDEMYRQYWYKSSLNSSMVSALRDVVGCCCDICDLKDGDMVVDIGCNDGTLLKCYQDIRKNLFRVGVDPSRNLADQAKLNCDLFINDYFGPNPHAKKAAMITAIAMFYDLEDINGFMVSVLDWLSDDGVFCIQMTDLLSMMRENAWDNICHEHLEYWSLSSLISLCDRHGMDVFKVSVNKVNGGSLRAFCCRKGKRPIENTVQEYLAEEYSWIVDGWRSFEINLHRSIGAIRSFLESCKQCGKRVCALGASTKGNTLLQTVGATSALIESIGEVSRDKFGLYTVGSGIPIIPEEDVLRTNPDHIMILPWHFINNLSGKLEGRSVMVPMPVPKLNGSLLW